MSSLFIAIYNRLANHRALFYSLLVILLGVIVFFGCRLQLEEDIRAIIPQDVRIDKINMVLSESSFSDRLVLNLELKEPADSRPDYLITAAEPLVKVLRKNTSHVKTVQFRMDQGAFQAVYDFIYKHLPFYLTAADYQAIEQRLTPDELQKTLRKSFQTLISPSGLALKKYIFKDPLNLTPMALKRLENFQLDDNFTLHNAVVFTKDKKNLLIFLEPVFSSAQTAENKHLIDYLDRALQDFRLAHPDLSIEYYGGTAVAVANADRIKQDIILTVSSALVVLLLFFYFFFRRLKVLLLLFFPVALGGGSSLALLSVLEGEISAIALGVGAVLLGISVDFSLHLLTHLRGKASIQSTLKDISDPVMMSSLTTASAFLCLFVVRSEALQQLGMFAAFSVALSAFFVLTVLPVFLKKSFPMAEASTKGSAGTASVTKEISYWPDRLAAYPFHRNKVLLLIVLGCSVVFLFTAQRISFNSDISSLNYLPPHLAKAEQHLTAVSSETLTAVYLVTAGENLNAALEKSEQLLSSVRTTFPALSISTATDLLLSQKQQQRKIAQWNAFWERMDRQKVAERLIEVGRQYHFKAGAFRRFYTYLERDFQPVNAEVFAPLRDLFLKNYVSRAAGRPAVISVLKADRGDKEKLYQLVPEADPNVVAFDRQYYTNQFFEILNEDFDKLVLLSMGIVLAILLVFYGRIELTIVTFIPIMLSWLWTLGLMGLFGISFNIFNIIISTFIFGLGIDYSIFVMRGLLNRYKYGDCELAPYKLSILLSAMTTVVGVGVLIFARHPALRSIAVVSIFGILSVVLIVYTVLPLVFSVLICSKGQRRREPVTFLNFIISVITLLIFVVGTVSLMVIIPLLSLLPLPRRKVKYLFHCLLMGTCRFIVFINVTIRKEYVNQEILDFKTPKVFIANHQSFLDLVLILLLSPRMIALTNEWVWKNPFIGFVVRFADYFPIFKGVDGSVEKIRQKVAEGYSVLVFPEGTRSSDGSIRRFHQGAFKLADELGLEIQPVLIHGAHHCAPKKEFFLRSGQITVKFLASFAAEPVLEAQGKTYSKQAKAVTRYFREEYEMLREQKETPDYFLKVLHNQYIYKGPVLEWYVKVKLRLEKNFTYFNRVIPRQGRITDIGCGYGYLGFMLQAVSPEREILGIDYDEEKIAVARRLAEPLPGLKFQHADITACELPESDVFIITDVLHYLPADLQKKVLEKCLRQVSANGMVIVRDADADLEERTRVTKHTELHSTKLLKFNKTRYDLSFVSGKQIEEVARANGFQFERVDNAKYTANITYILRREAKEPRG